MHHHFPCVSFMMVILWFVFMARFELIPTLADTILCNERYECANTTLSNPDDYVEISSYFGASHSNLNVSSISALSAFSIYKSKSINLNGIYTVVCEGLYSCAMVQKMNILGSIFCSGELSCHGSDITVKQEKRIYCYGDRSCSNSIFRGIYETVYLQGRLSGFNSTFITHNEYTEFQFDGSFSEYGASIICCNNCTCDIYCPISNCKKLNYQCSSGMNGNCSINIYYAASGYVSSFEGLYEIDYPILDDENELINNFLFEISTFDNSAKMCKDNNAAVIDCFDEEECRQGEDGYDSLDYNDTIDGNISLGVCCEGSESCFGLKEIGILNNDLRCDGFRACANNQQVTIKNGDMYFSGWYAGGSTDYSNSKEYSALGGNIYATGYIALQNTYYDLMDGINSTHTILNSKNVYCTGYGACGHTNIVNISNNVYFYGYNNYYRDQIISDIGNTVYINTYFRMGGIFKNIYKMVAIGTNSVNNGEINNVRVIEVYGLLAMSETDIVSNIHFYDNYAGDIHGDIDKNDNEFNLTLYGPISGYNMRLTCSENDVCYINCIGEYSCFYSKFYCNGYCILTCNSGHCPDGGQYSALIGNYTIIEIGTDGVPSFGMVVVKIVVLCHLFFGVLFLF